MYGNKRRSQNEKLNFLFEYIFKKNIEFLNFVQLKRIKITTEVAIDKYIYMDCQLFLIEDLDRGASFPF